MNDFNYQAVILHEFSKNGLILMVYSMIPVEKSYET